MTEAAAAVMAGPDDSTRVRSAAWTTTSSCSPARPAEARPRRSPTTSTARWASVETLRFSEGNLFVRVLENVRGRDVFLVQGTGVPGQRQLHGAAVLDRRAQAGQRRVGHRGHPVLQLRQGRQEGRAPGVDPRPGVRRRHRGGRRRPGRHAGPARPAGAGVLPGPRRRPLRPAGAVRRRSQAKDLANLVVVAPDAGFAKKAAPVGRPARRPAGHRRQAARRPHRVGRGGRADRRRSRVARP